MNRNFIFSSTNASNSHKEEGNAVYLKLQCKPFMASTIRVFRISEIWYGNPVCTDAGKVTPKVFAKVYAVKHLSGVYLEKPKLSLRHSLSMSYLCCSVMNSIYLY